MSENNLIRGVFLSSLTTLQLNSTHTRVGADVQSLQNVTTERPEKTAIGHNPTESTLVFFIVNKHGTLRTMFIGPYHRNRDCVEGNTPRMNNDP
jgi:hypothetical protein